MTHALFARIKQWWNEDNYRRWLLVGGVGYALFFSQGIPLWDDDFTSWFKGRDILNKSVFSFAWEWIWPVSSQPQYWGFNERPAQALVYKVFHALAGYQAWAYFLYKSVVFGFLGVMIYMWGVRLAPASLGGRVAALAAAVFFLLMPGPLAAHILHQDFAPTAELFFLVLTYFMWDAVEKTPASWKGVPETSYPWHFVAGPVVASIAALVFLGFQTPFNATYFNVCMVAVLASFGFAIYAVRGNAEREWFRKWAVFAFLTYLGYKCKADLKIIPFILAAYVFFLRRHQWAYFAVPVFFMLFFAMPWGPGIFAKLPPFMPGSQGSEIAWMYKPATLARMWDFVWAKGGFDFVYWMKASTVSLFGLVGLLFVPIVAFLLWKSEGALDKVPWFSQSTARDRSRTFILLWFAAIFAASSALPDINYTFQIRYGILTMVPTCILLAWVFGLFAESIESLPLGRVGAVLCFVIFALQAGINLNRSISYRRDMGQVMVAVDQVYEHIEKKYPNERLALFPDFRPYDYKSDGPKAISEKIWLGKDVELIEKTQPFQTYVISWKPTLWEQLDVVEHFSGCRESSLFDRIFSCPKGTGTYLMRYVGSDPLFAQGEALRAKRDFAGARQLHEQFLAKNPRNLAAHFVLGLEAFEMKDWKRSEQAYSFLEGYFPEHSSILYNRALALKELGQYAHAIERLKWIATREPTNYPVLINLYWAYQLSGDTQRAKATLVAMKRVFPDKQEVDRLLASG